VEGKAAVIGDANFVMPFSAMGLDTYCVGETAEQISQCAKEVAAEHYALVVVAENIAPTVDEVFFAPTVDEVFSEYQYEPTPCVVVVPFTTESKGFATDALAGVLKMATGIDILQGS